MMVEIKQLPNGGHRNQSSTPHNIPDGWAVVPMELDMPNFPFGEVETEEIEGVMTVTQWTPGVKPAAEPEKEAELTAVEQLVLTQLQQQETIDALVALQLGGEENV